MITPPFAIDRLFYDCLNFVLELFAFDYDGPIGGFKFYLARFMF